MKAALQALYIKQQLEQDIAFSSDCMDLTFSFFFLQGQQPQRGH